MRRLFDFLAATAQATVDILTNRLVLILLFIAAIYWSVAFFVPGAIMIEAMGLVAIVVYAAVVVHWTGPAMSALRTGQTGGVPQLLLGVVLFVASSDALRIWAQIWRWNDYVDWMVRSPILGFIILSTICSAAMMITSPGASEEGVPNQNWKFLSIAIGVGALVVGFVLGSSYSGRSELPLPVLASTEKPQCLPDRPFWGNRASGIVHGPASPFRHMVVPDACFSSEDEARNAGYRIPRT